MTSSILEATRALHEDIELFERAIVQVMLQEPKSVYFFPNSYTDTFYNLGFIKNEFENIVYKSLSTSQFLIFSFRKIFNHILF
jgi:hypothetical protein